LFLVLDAQFKWFETVPFIVLSGKHNVGTEQYFAYESLFNDYIKSTTGFLKKHGTRIRSI